MTARVDRTGNTYGHLVALHDTGKAEKGARIWAARCTVIRDGQECGRVIETYRLWPSVTPQSCGCLLAGVRRVGKRSRHGHAGHGNRRSSTYRSWRKMKDRCHYPKDVKYKSYGAKGVSVCDRWRDFRNFLSDMGERLPGTTLGRILDRGNYEPGNCFWMTPAEQGLARQNNNALLRWELSRATIRKPSTGVGLDQEAIA